MPNENQVTPSDIAARSVDQTAARYGISRTAVKEEIRSGRLVARKLGRRTIILETDELAWANALPRFSPGGENCDARGAARKSYEHAQARREAAPA